MELEPHLLYEEHVQCLGSGHRVCVSSCLVSTGSENSAYMEVKTALKERELNIAKSRPQETKPAKAKKVSAKAGR